MVEGTWTLARPMKLKDTTTSGSGTKLLENGCNSRTSMTSGSADVDVDGVDLEISSFWLHNPWFQKMS